MAGGSLSYRIELDSAEAEAAFGALQKAANGFVGTLQQAVASFKGGGFEQLGKTLGIAAGAITGITGALFAMAKASSDVVDELGELADQVGSTVEEISTLKSALVALEANGSTLQRAFLKMGNAVQEVWPEIEKSVKNAATQVIGNQIAVEKATLDLAKANLTAAGSTDDLRRAYLGVEQAGLALAQAEQKVADLADEVSRNIIEQERAVVALQQSRTELARFSSAAALEEVNNQLAIASAMQGVEDAQIALAQAQGKTVSQETLRKNAIARAALALEAAEQRAAEAQAKAEQAREDRAIKLRQLQLAEQAAAQSLIDIEKKRGQEGLQQQLAQLQLEQARLTLSEAGRKAEQAELQARANKLAIQEAELRQTEARKKQRDDELNSIKNLKAHVEALAAGTSTAGIKINATVDNMIKGLVAAVGPGVTALDGIGSSIEDIKQRAPGLMPVLLKLADVFKNTEDGALKLAIATKLFGRKDAVNMVEALSEGSAAILEQQRRMSELGLAITNTDGAISKKFIKSLNLLKETVKIVGTQLGLLFQPAFTEALNAIQQTLAENRTRILEWGAAIRDTLVPILQTFVRVLLGVPEAGKDDWLVKIVNNIKKFAGEVKGAVDGIIMPAFRGLMAVLDKVADSINSVFGTTLTGGEIGIALAVAQLLGGFTTLGAVVLTVIGFVKLLGLIVTGVAAVLAAPFELVALAIAGFIAGIVLFIMYWDDVKAAAQRALDFIIVKLKQAYEWFKAFVLSPIADAWKWIVTAFDDAIEAVKKKAQEAYEAVKAFVLSPIADAWKWIVTAFDDAIEAVKEKLQELFKASAAKGGNTAPEIPAIPQSAPAPVPLDERPQPASLRDQGQQVQSVSDQAKAAITALETFATTALQIVRSLATEVATAITTVFTGISTITSTTAQQITAAFTELGLKIGQLLATGVQTGVDEIVQIVAALGETLQGAMSALQAGVTAIGTQISAVVANVIAELKAAIAAAQELAAAAASAASASAASRSGGGGGGAPFARGGYTGAGSRMTPAGIVHRGEYVQPANVVGRPGVLAFMEMLRRTGDLQTTIRRFTRGFDVGGLVDGLNRSLVFPGFAAGGLAPASAGRHITVDLRTNAGTFAMTTDEDTAVALTRVARRRETHGMSKPSWYK